MADEILSFESLADFNKWIDGNVPNGVDSFTSTLEAIDFGAKMPSNWQARTASQRMGFLRQLDDVVAKRIASEGGEWANTVRVTFMELGKPYVGAVTWRSAEKPREDWKAEIERAKRGDNGAGWPAALALRPAAPSPQRPPSDLAPDAVPRLIQRIAALCEDAYRQNAEMRVLYYENMGMEWLGADVGPPPGTAGTMWRGALAAHIAYLEVTLGDSRMCYADMRGE